MRQRVFTYITRENELLVFDHVDYKYLEPQIPGGTIEQGEEPEIAAIREATEETGLSQFLVRNFLGSFIQDLRPIGRDETVHAWFYHLETSDQTDPRWRHFELDPSEGTDPIEFELYWVPLTNIPKLGGIDNAMLSELEESVLKASA